MNIHVLPIFAVCVLLTAGCEQSTAASAEDVPEDHANTTENSKQAYSNRDEITAAQAIFEKAMADAQGAQDIAKEECTTLNSTDKEACVNRTIATLAAAEASAIAARDRSLAAADQQI